MTREEAIVEIVRQAKEKILDPNATPSFNMAMGEVVEASVRMAFARDLSQYAKVALNG